MPPTAFSPLDRAQVLLRTLRSFKRLRLSFEQPRTGLDRPFGHSTIFLG